MNLPSIRQLQYLIAVVDLHHFGRAAERCFVTQSTLSAGIQELETLLGVKLLERSKRKVIPTAVGERVAAQARQLLVIAEGLVATARDDGTPLSGLLRLGVIPTIGPFLLPRILPVIRREFPRLELQLLEEQSARIVQRLEEGTLDAAIIAFPYPTGRLESELFWEEEFRLALPKGHPLARLEAIATEGLPKEELLLLEEGHCLTDHALAACKLEGLKSSAAFQGTSLYTLLQMVAGGMGITFVPELALTTELAASGEIELVRLAEPGPHRRIGLVWRTTWHRKGDMRLLAGRMRGILEGRGSG